MSEMEHYFLRNINTKSKKFFFTINTSHNTNLYP